MRISDWSSDVCSSDLADYRDDVLRLLFVCCHPELPATQQIALALRIVSGMKVPEIARAFLVGDSAMEQRITRAKARIAQAGATFEIGEAQGRERGVQDLVIAVVPDTLKKQINL